MTSPRLPRSSRPGSVSTAARRLEVAKPVVSKRVTELERDPDATVLKRSPRSVRLTARGGAFCAPARDHDDARRGRDRGSRGGRRAAGPAALHCAADLRHDEPRPAALAAALPAPGARTKIWSGRPGGPGALEELPRHDRIGREHLAAGQEWQLQPVRGKSDVRSVRVQRRFVTSNVELMRGATIAGWCS
jgi:Bacterial regulatory helix-turn-helix protein, lysR family